MEGLPAQTGQPEKLPRIAEPLEMLRAERQGALSNLDTAQRILNRLRGANMPAGVPDGQRNEPVGIVANFHDVANDFSNINKQLAEVLAGIGDIV